MKLRCHLPCLSEFLIAQLAFPKEHLKHLEHLKSSRSFSSGLLTSGEVLVDGREGLTPGGRLQQRTEVAVGGPAVFHPLPLCSAGSYRYSFKERKKEMVKL